MSPYLLYTVGRLAIFAIVAGVLYLLGFSALLLIALALVVSVPLSAVLLKGLRRRVTEDLTRRMDERQEKRERLHGALREDQDEN